MALSAVKDNKITIIGDGTQVRSFVHVKDTAAAYKKILETDTEVVNNQIYNVGSNEQNYSILQLADIIEKVIGRGIPREFSGKIDSRNYSIDFSKIRGIGFKPRYSVDDGVRELKIAIEKQVIEYENKNTRTDDWYEYVKPNAV